MPHPVPYIAIVDVGHGNSAVLKNEEAAVIVDCGARGSGLLEFLERENITEINSVFLSHSDQDHIGGLIALLAEVKFTVREVYLNADATKGSMLWDGLVYELSHLAEKGVLKYHVGITRGPEFRWGDLGLTVVGPSGYLAAKGAGGLDMHDREITSNSLSASFQVSWNGTFVAFLAGDIDQVGLDDLVDHKADIASPLLVFPHHGGNTDGYDNVEFTRQLCSLVQPTTVVFSNGRNKHNNPRPEIVATVRAAVNDVRIACTQLSKTCAVNIPKTVPTHLVEFFSRGLEKKECCSGTFVISLSNPITYLPNFNLHRDFIIASAPNALCN